MTVVPVKTTPNLPVKVPVTHSEPPHGGHTDSMWYLAANDLVPQGIHHVERLRWIEGFVMALEIVRGIDAPAGLSEVLRSTCTVPQGYVELDETALAYMLFNRQCDEYEATEDQRRIAWAEDKIREFWLGEAAAVTKFLYA